MARKEEVRNKTVLANRILHELREGSLQTRPCPDPAGDRMNRQDELRKIIADAQSELEEFSLQERFDANAKFVGKHYRFRNGYGGSRHKWWLYTKVTGLSESGNLQGFRFQSDCDGRIEIETGRYIAESTLGEFISEKDFEDAKSALLSGAESALS